MIITVNFKKKLPIISTKAKLSVNFLLLIDFLHQKSQSLLIVLQIFDRADKEMYENKQKLKAVNNEI